MSNGFITAMKKAAAVVRSGDPREATRIIQAALGSGAATPAPRPPEPSPRPAARPRLDPNAETVEPLGEATAPRRRGPRLHKPLREALRTLREGRRVFDWQLPGTVEPAAPPRVPEGARFETRTFACSAGARDFRLYVPSGKAGPVRGLVVMLHGCKQNPDDFATGTGMNALAETRGLIVAYPGQTAAENLSSCWNWFRPGDQRRDAGEPAILAGLTGTLVAEFGIDPRRVYVAGLSAGGAMAAVLGEAYPDVFTAVGIHSGVPTGASNDVLSALAAMRGEAGLAAGRTRPEGAAVRTIVFHGTADTTVRPVNAERIAAAAGAEPSLTREDRGAAPGGRSYTRRVQARAGGAPDIEVWLIDGAGHAWSGGQAPGSFTDPAGPDASAEMLRFFLQD